jgi:hypothetical protein
MPHQDDLFSELPQPEAQPAGHKVVALKFRDAALTPAQKAFNRLLTRIENLSAKLEATRTLADGHRVRSATELEPLERAQCALMRQMVLLLAGRLERKGLTRAQKQAATDIACGLSETLALQGDTEMQVLHDALSPQTLDEKDREAADDMRAMLENILGVPLHEGDEAGAMDHPDAVLQAAMRRMGARAEAEKAERHAQRAAKAGTARQRKAEQETLDAQTALRTVYRQLASALHPDRETDPAERARKTALMSEANAAYERRDLVTLLHLRLRAEHLDAGTVANLAKEKIAALTVLLKEQVGALEHDLWTLEQQVRGEFELRPGAVLSAASLQRLLRERQQLIQLQIVQMQRDLQRVQDDAQLKRWLKEQAAMAAQADPFDDGDFY